MEQIIMALFCDYDLEQFCIYVSAMKKYGSQGKEEQHITNM